MDSITTSTGTKSTLQAYAQTDCGVAGTVNGYALNRRPQQTEKCLLILDNRVLDRECLARGLLSHDLCLDVAALASIDEWRREKVLHPPLAAILLNIRGRQVTDPSVGSEIARLASEFRSIPLMLLADSDDLSQILKALEYGVRCYIPTSVGINVCVGAISLAMAGGMFVPASSVLAVRNVIDSDGSEMRSIAEMFTPRQAEVVKALRQGKANKIIAYELNLRESTVKVHVRTIMKKLNATNRTEVAFKINSLVSGQLGPDDVNQLVFVRPCKRLRPGTATATKVQSRRNEKWFGR
jgi:DNA-binding NarL/FixJ family response regulator